MNYLAQHPATAKRIAHKLATRFVGDNPPAALVHSLAAIYRHHKTDIRPVLRALFSSKAFHHAEHVKYRTPFEDLVATLRSLRYQPDAVGTEGIRDLQWIAGSLGQPPLRMARPQRIPRRRPGVGCNLDHAGEVELPPQPRRALVAGQAACSGDPQAAAQASTRHVRRTRGCAVPRVVRTAAHPRPAGRRHPFRRPCTARPAARARRSPRVAAALSRRARLDSPKHAKR